MTDLKFKEIADKREEPLSLLYQYYVIEAEAKNYRVVSEDEFISSITIYSMMQTMGDANGGIHGAVAHLKKQHNYTKA